MSEEKNPYISVDEKGVATFELKSPEAFLTFKKGLEHGTSYWSAHPETNELLKFRSENCNNARIFVKYSDYVKQIR